MAHAPSKKIFGEKYQQYLKQLQKEKEIEARNRTWTPLQIDSLSPISKNFYINLRMYLDEWAQRSTSTHMMSFPAEHNISNTTMVRYRDVDPDLQEAWDKAQERVSARRQLLGEMGDLNPQMVQAYLPVWDKEYRAWLLEKQKAGKEEADKKIKVEFEICPKTNEVPEREED